MFLNGKRRIIRVYLRELVIITKNFKFVLLAFMLSMTVGTVSLRWKYHISIPRAIHESMALMFLAATLPFPEDDLFLEMLWIFYPLIAVTLIAEGLAKLGESLKLRDITSTEWNESMAKELENHIIIIGLGNVGLRVVEFLATQTNLDFIGIDPLESKDSDLKRDYQEKYRFPLIVGKGERMTNLEKANISKARAILALTDNDLLNLKIALIAKKMNMNIITVVRMFDVEFGELVKESFNIDHVVSTTKLAAPHFVKILTTKDL